LSNELHSHFVVVVNPLFIWMLLNNLIVGFKTKFFSSSITMLCNMTHVINTSVTTLQSHNQQGFTMICHFAYKTPRQPWTLLQVASYIAKQSVCVFLLVTHGSYIQNKTTKGRFHWLISSGENVYFHSFQNWGPHLHPPKIPDSYLKRSNHCYFQPIQSIPNPQPMIGYGL
jgi:hypothetical protein